MYIIKGGITRYIKNELLYYAYFFGYDCMKKRQSLLNNRNASSIEEESLYRFSFPSCKSTKSMFLSFVCFEGGTGVIEEIRYCAHWA